MGLFTDQRLEGPRSTRNGDSMAAEAQAEDRGKLMFSREIRAEYVSRKLRSFYRRQPRIDNGEQDKAIERAIADASQKLVTFHRSRLGIEDRRTTVMAARDALPPVTVLDASENLLRAAERFERVNGGWNEDMDGRR